MERIPKGAVSFVLAAIVLCFVFLPTVDTLAATTWYVDDDAPADFATIQAAIDAASDGDTIIVRDSLYTGRGPAMITTDKRAEVLGPAVGIAALGRGRLQLKRKHEG